MPPDTRIDNPQRAMELLHKAIDFGFDDVDRLKSDAELVPLREREDFQKLVAGLEAESSEAPNEASSGE